MYAKIVRRGVLVSEFPLDGYKPLINTRPEPPEGYRAVSELVDEANAILEIWKYIELTDEEKREAADHSNDPTADEALTRYANELTNGNAETLTEATENLIKIVKEDK